MELPGLDSLPGIPLPLLRGDVHACPYLPDREASALYALPLESIDGELYQDMMDRGFRRAGTVFYKPDCPACSACVPIRVPVDAFRPTRSQRRVLRRNADVSVSVGPPSADEEHHALFLRYQHARHDGELTESRDRFEDFLCHSPIDSFELAFRLDGRLVAVSILDRCPDSLSSVYVYFDAGLSQRSLGVFSALAEIEQCRREGRSYWYIGFHISGCSKMEYKTRFRPYELKRGSRWQRFDDVPRSG